MVDRTGGGDVRTRRPQAAAASCSSSLLKRRVIFGILAVCISLSRTQNVTTPSAPPADDPTTSRLSTGVDINTTASSAFLKGHGHQANCSKPAIEEFPVFFLDAKQRANGGIALPVAIVLYLIFALGSICDDYFVPALEMICDKLNLSNDVAGATFMAAGTSSPEFFTNVMGTFVTKSDLGIGTIVGSAVFNIFCVIATCGLFAGRQIPLNWYPITRDCAFYGITVIILIVVLNDAQVVWYESVVMISFYFVYIMMMAFNNNIEKWAVSTKCSVSKRISSKTRPNESTPLHSARKPAQVPAVATTPASCDFGNNNHFVGGGAASSSFGLQPDGEAAGYHANGAPPVEEEEDEECLYPWQRPEDAGFLGTIWWALYFPVSLAYFLTIPDMRRVNDEEGLASKAFFKHLYPVSFVMCMAWIGAISYVVTWMITLIGYTIGVPDSVMGLSFLAVGTSIPEVFSSLIVCRQGKGSMAVSNSIGSNTFDILVCLGVPWLFKSVMSGTNGGGWVIEVDSEGLTYTVISLLLSLVILYVILLVGRFVLTRTVACVCLVIYAVFLTISLLFELNVFFLVNDPACRSNY